jgi:UDP-N-acetyl-D-mannosaminuronate dehydrogenase
MTHDADSLEFAAEARNGGAHRYDPDVQLIVHELSTYAGTTDEVMGPILEEWS